MINIFWPIYKNIEKEFTELMFSIHIDNNQLNVYSPKIADLIFRTAIEVESISKELYLRNGGTIINRENIKFDYDVIKHLNTLWKLDSKIVIISTPFCYISDDKRELHPFKKDEQRTNNTKMTFGWNNAYQGLKHDKINNLKLGNIKYLFSILSALYILNIYFKDETFSLGEDSSANSFSLNLGSDIFSIKVHACSGSNTNGECIKKENFNECLYIVRRTKNSQIEYIETIKEFNLTHKETFNKLLDKKIEYIKSDASAIEKLSQDEELDLEELLNIPELQTESLKQTTFKVPNFLDAVKGQYECILNKENI